MNLIYGEVIELLTENGMRFGKVRVGGALRRVPLDLLTGIDCGDRVLLCDGVAISKVKEVPKSE
jgi:hydrogenase maturation factor